MDAMCRARLVQSFVLNNGLMTVVIGGVFIRDAKQRFAHGFFCRIG